MTYIKLQACEAMVSKCGSEISGHIPAIVDLCLEYITYDPNYNYDEEDDSDELEMIQKGSNEIILNNDEIEVENGKNDNNETVDHKQIRRSERIKKRIVDINPDDIGENDNENDEDYK